MSAPNRLPLRPPITGPAQMIAFPIATRVHQIEKLATRIRQVTRDRGEFELARELNAIRSRLAKQGLSADQVAEQVAALEGRVRAALWDAVILGAGAEP